MTTSDSLTRLRSSPADNPLQVYFSLALSRMIDAAQADQAQLRHTIYELARVKLREEFRHRDVEDIERLVAALDGAIEGVESFADRRDSQPEWQSALARLAAPDDVVRPFVAARTILHGDHAAPMLREKSAAGEARIDPGAAGHLGKLPSRAFPSTSFAVVGRLVLIGALIAGSGATALNWTRLHRIALEWRPSASDVALTQSSSDTNGREAPDTPSPTSHPPPAPTAPGFPLPSSFGVYAIDGDRLVELKPLPGRVPDPRVAISAAITTPSDARLASSQPRFVLFRRDLVANAPEALQMRVVAKVRSAMAARRDAKSSEARETDTWVIRNISLPYRVGPIEGQSEMILIQPEADDRPLPAGRYALVIKGQAFDLSVDGRVTDPRHCLERVNAANGTFYTPCPGG